MPHLTAPQDEAGVGGGQYKEKYSPHYTQLYAKNGDKGHGFMNNFRFWGFFCVNYFV